MNVVPLDIWRIRLQVAGIRFFSRSFTSWYGVDGVEKAIEKIEDTRVGPYLYAIERQNSDLTWEVV